MNEEKKIAWLYIRVSTEDQARDDRKINNYFSKIANDNKHDLAVEIIIELGNMYYWSDKTIEEKYKMVSVFEKQVINLEKLIPSFKKKIVKQVWKNKLVKHHYLQKNL